MNLGSSRVEKKAFDFIDNLKFTPTIKKGRKKGMKQLNLKNQKGQKSR
jgi:hypothetical protein